MEEKNNSRRSFIKLATLGTAALGLGTLGNGLANAALPFASDQPKPKGKSVMGLTCDPIETVRIGIIGIGMRGSEAVRRLMQIEGASIRALCDVRPELLKEANSRLREAGLPEAAEYTGPDDWMKICERDDIDLIYSCTPWTLHTPVSVYAMKQGKHAATEVPAALTIDECWQLVDTAEETQRHCMMLENCCYDFFELNTLNMARQGVFGDILHAEGAYIHDLRELKFLDEAQGGYYDYWRLKYSMKHTGNPYPTHGLGPIAQIMGINRGDRFISLTSMSSRQEGLSLYAAATYGSDSPQARQSYALGDMNTTLIQTEKGKTLMLQHNTTSPRPYNRLHLISGTKGMARKYPVQAIALEPESHHFAGSDAFNELMKTYEHPLSRQIGEKAKLVGGHGGMDFIMDYRLIYCLRNGLPLDQDVYDAAAWSSVVQLSELSVTHNSNAVEVPDFTRGAWKTAKPLGIVSISE